MRRARLWILLAAGLALSLAPVGADARGGHGHGGHHHGGGDFHHGFSRRPFVSHHFWVYDRFYDPFYSPFYDPWYDPWYGGYAYWSWYGDGWPYRYGPPYRSWVRHRVYAPQRDYVGVYDAQENELPPGWQALADGRDTEALELFRGQSVAAPRHALPKVGYALAAAALGDTDQAIWAMRRAAQTDPDSFPDAPLDDAIRERARQLAAELQPKPTYDYGTSDDYFLLAALHYVADDMDEAHRAIERAIQKADASASTRNLRRLIKEAGDSRSDA